MYFPVAFEKDIMLSPKSIQFQQRNLVVWKSNKGVVCMPNKCPHRNAKLSEGRVIQEDRIECPYHGWQFKPSGKCVKVPQLPKNTKIPMACSLKPFPSKIYDDIVWVSLQNNATFTEVELFKNNDKYYVSDYYLKAPYSYELQIENLLDPAHLHFVHDGFQGNRQRVSPIQIKNFKETDTLLYGYFEHDNKDTPDIEISFYKPAVIIVSIYNKKSKDLLRKNVIYVSPIDEKSCNVLFRDVAFKNTLIPQDNPFIQFHSQMLLNGPAKDVIEEHYQFVNLQIIEKIMDQDLEVLKDQQENIMNYKKSKYVLPAQCDRLIVAFRKWYSSFSFM